MSTPHPQLRLAVLIRWTKGFSLSAAFFNVGDRLFSFV
jgi:hypothetical protein